MQARRTSFESDQSLSSNGMNSMKRTSMGRARASAAKASTSCSFTPGVGEDGFGYRGGRGEGLDLVLVHTAHHHAVQLERRVPQRQRRVHRAQHLWRRAVPAVSFSFC